MVRSFGNGFGLVVDFRGGETKQSSRSVLKIKWLIRNNATRLILNFLSTYTLYSLGSAISLCSIVLLKFCLLQL